MIFGFFLHRLFIFRIGFCIFLICNFGLNCSAQSANSDIGSVTGLQIPRFVSIKSSKVNVRRGPNSTYQIDWVYTKAGIPLKVIAEFGNWRRVKDFQGEGGWVHSRLLSGKRFVVFLDDKSMLKRKPNQKSPAVAIIERGVIARLVSTTGDWVEVSVDSHSGWVRSDAIWGTYNRK